MKSNNAMHRITALLCIATVLLLSCALVSPQVHSWVFHGSSAADGACQDSHTACTNPSEDGSEPDIPKNETEFCPVVLFEQGVILTGGFEVQLPQFIPLLGSIAIEPETISDSGIKSTLQARAPPIS